MNVISGKTSKELSIETATAFIGKEYTVRTVNVKTKKIETIVFSNEEIKKIVRAWNKELMKKIKGE